MASILDRAIDGGDVTSDDREVFHTLAEDDKKLFAASFGEPVEGAMYSSRKGDVGYLALDGPIIPRATWFSQMSGITSLDVLSSEFKALEDDATINKIVLLVDSPGGVVGGVSDFAALVASSEKETASFVWMAASAAYWIASATDTIVSSHAGMVGSIGVVLSFDDTSEAQIKKGIRHVEIVSSASPNKRPDYKNEQGLSVLQKEVDDLADVFIETVAKNRGVTTDKVLSDFGQGGVLVAPQALTVGMVDMITDVHAFAKDIEAKEKFNVASRDFNLMSAMEIDSKGEEMSEEKTDDMKAIEQEARASERARIQAIEGIAKKFDSALPSVKNAALAAINENKFDADATVESVSLKVLDVVAAAQVGELEAQAAGRREAAVVAAAVGTDTPPPADVVDKNAESESRVSKLDAAFRALKGDR
jgi:ClpP class serine protease